MYTIVENVIGLMKMDIVIRMVNTVGLYRSKYVGPRPIVEHKLEMNCDFSSNNIIVGLSFMSFWRPF